MMYKKYFAILAFCGIPLMACCQSIPKITTRELQQMIDTAKVPLVINFWATWCRPCIDEMPVLQKAAALYQKQGLRLVLVSMDFPQDYPAKLEAFVQKHQYLSQIYWLNEGNPLTFCKTIDPKWTARIPATLMINNAKHYREFYYYGMVAYQAAAYFKDLVY